MSDEFVIVPSRESDYHEIANLSRTKRSGRLFKKHILNKGPLIHPTTGDVIMIDDKFISTLKKNFDEKVCDIVQVPLANDRNEHTEDPTRNIGEVVDLQEESGKVYAVIDVRDEDAAKKLGHTLLGASAMLNLNYVDTKTGKRVGPTLLHSCVTNRPYITNLDEYEEIVSATNSADSSNRAVLLTVPEDSEITEVGETQSMDDVEGQSAGPNLDESFWARFKNELAQALRISVEAKESQEEASEADVEIDQSNEETVSASAEDGNVSEEENIEENAMTELTKEELISQLKEHGIDVAALQASAESATKAEKELEEVTALSNTLSEDVKTANEKAAQAEELAKKLGEELSSSGVLKLTNGEELSPEDVIGAVSELAQGHLALTNQVKELREKDAEREVDALVAEGRITPAQKDAMVELKLTNASMFDRLVPEKPVVSMEEEIGTEPDKGEKHESDVDAAIARFTASDGPLGKIAKIRK